MSLYACSIVCLWSWSLVITLTDRCPNEMWVAYLSQITQLIVLASVTTKDWSDGLLRVRPDFRSPIGLCRTSDGVRRTSDTILGLILTILGLKAFIWSPSRTSTSPIRVRPGPIRLRWNLSLPLQQLKKSDRTRSDPSKIEDFIKISPIGLFWSPIGLVDYLIKLVRSDSTSDSSRTPTNFDRTSTDSDRTLTK